MSDRFVHCHLHSEYSLVDGIIRIPDLIQALIKTKSTACAITDQSNLFATIKFYKEAIKVGIKPIIGADVWVSHPEMPEKPSRLILLCQNDQGYRHLMELISDSYIRGQVRDRAIIDQNLLKEKNKGLLAIANVKESDIGEAFEVENFDRAAKLYRHWANIFINRYYLEITRTRQPQEFEYLQKLVYFAEKNEVPLVATNNVHFLTKADFEAHEARVCIHQGVTINNAQHRGYYTEEQYLKSPDDMIALFSDIPEAIENSIEIAKRCHLELKLGQAFLPKYPVPNFYTAESYLCEQAEKGLKSRMEKSGTIPENYRDRLKMELSVINSMHFAGYFLIVADFIRWAKAQNIPVGPGRGSGAGSLVAYALEITGLDPIQHDLLFERFLNPERVSMPDFDIDFCMEGRDRVIDYVTETYGRDSVSQIITFGTMAAKAVIRDVGRVLGLSYTFVDRIAKLIPHELGITLEKALKDEELLRKAYAEDDEIKTLVDLAKKLEGITRNVSKHAGGVVIAPSKLTDFVPLYCDTQEGVIITQFDKNDVEEIGLVKFDFLGLRTLTIIYAAVDIINEELHKTQQPLIDINAIPMDDPKTFDLLKACHTVAVFQLESRGMRDLVRRLRPDIFEEIVALVALFRPGPLQSGLVEDFINRKHGRAALEYLHPKLVSVLKNTYGIILYQEQVTQIAQVLAGYSLGTADLLRKAMGKKKPEEMAKHRETFIEGAVLRGVDAHTAEYIFDLMEKFAGYGFNKSHASAYAMLTYQTAWLKAHFPAPFMAAVLSSDMAHTDKVVAFIDECRYLNIPVEAPDINRSDYKFKVTPVHSIIFGLGAIKGVGEAAISSIIETRQVRPFKNIFDFCLRTDSRKVSRRVLEALIKAGALDSFGLNRASLMASVEEAVRSAEQLNKNQSQGQIDLFGALTEEEDLKLNPQTAPVTPEWPKTRLLEGEKETLGFYFSGHPLEEHLAVLKLIKATAINNLNLESGRHYVIAGLIATVRVILTKKGDKMAFIAIDDNTGRQEVAIFSDLFREQRELLQKDSLVVIEGELSIDNFSGGYKMRALSLMGIQEARFKAVQALKINLAADQTPEADFSNKLQQILRPYRGGHCAIQIYYQQAESPRLLRLGDAWRITPQEKLIADLKTLCGEGAVELCY